MQLSRRTPRTELLLNTLAVKISPLLDDLIAQGYNKTYADAELTRFILLSSRADPSEGELDFDLAQISDSQEVLRGKFFAYWETECMATVTHALQQLDQMDLPYNPTTAPTPPTGDVKK